MLLYRQSLLDQEVYELVTGSRRARGTAPQKLRFRVARCQRCHVVRCECLEIRARLKLRQTDPHWHEEEW